MPKQLRNPAVMTFSVAVVIFMVFQILFYAGSPPLLNDYWRGIVFWGAAITILSLGLNLIYGFNGQFSLGQYGFYAIGSYASADVSYRWVHGDSSALVVLVLGVILSLLFFAGVSRFLHGFYGVTARTKFSAYLLVTILAFFLAFQVNLWFGAGVYPVLNALPTAVSQPLVFFCALLGGTALAGIVSFLFGLPVLELGSDYFGIATLGFTVIVKVLLDSSDLVFPEMKGARGMLGIPAWTTWPWVFGALILAIVVMRNLLHSSYGRTIVSVREDERAATLVGIDVGSAKLLAFVVGSCLAGLAGGIRAHDAAFLHPNSFNFVQSFNPLIIVVFGGLGSMTGTVLTGFVWIFLLEGVLRNVLPPGFETWRFVIYPLVLLIMMLLRPEGLLGKYEIPFLRQVLPGLRQRLTKTEKQEAAK